MRDLTCNGEFPLARFSSIHLKNLDETQSQLSRLIRQHDVLDYGVQHGPTELEYAPLASMSVSSVCLGTEMTAVAQPANDSLLIFTALDNPFEILIDNEPVPVSADRVAIVSPGRSFTLHGRTQARSILLNIERQFLETLLLQELEISLNRPIEFLQSDSAESSGESTMARFMRFLRNEIKCSSPQIQHAGHLGRLESLAASSLIYNIKHNYSAQMLRADSSAAPRYVRRAIDYIHAYAQRPLTLQSLAKISATSPRSLVRGFQKYKNCSPIAYLKLVRLDFAHQDLSNGLPEDTSVTRVAYKWRFSNLGRFAAAYRERFGENPAQTLRREFSLH